ncbi:MAG: aldolase/citrate lyase family protein [Sphaerobacter sp.]|nr:aldolase/citrate lyase family protein [Sphaerobacter sp.]MDI3341375.1 aldolase/citrate lyase family protein [Sphaerobacter sp.]
MRGNHVRRRLQAGEASIGTWLALPSPEAAEHIGRLGFDWLVVDTEHYAIDIRTLAQMFTAIAASDTAPMVRIPWNDPVWFKRVLDAGAWGVVVPMVNSRAEAERAVAATRYPPLGTRSVGGGRHALSFDTTAAEYYRHANDEILLVVQIEHIDAVERVDEILSVPGIDACFIGPNDLAASMGLGLGVSLEHDHPRLVEAIAHVRETAVACGVAPGIHCSHADGVNQRLAEGFRFCGMASELRYLVAGLRADLQRLHWTPAEPCVIASTGEGDVVRY